ncbi:MAG: hypothetical protein IT169_03975 [Bryobacterales bacterium]|nr:hypothetical protein [Bryobacterales bacterium]
MLSRRKALSLAGTPLLSTAAQVTPEARVAAHAKLKYSIPERYLLEEPNIPPYWVNEVEPVERFLQRTVKRGTVSILGRTAGNREIPMVSYGGARKGEGTSTYSGSMGYGDVRAYLGPDWSRKVYCALVAVHGGEFEGIVGAVNLLSVLETGMDLRGKRWPALTKAAAGVDRILVIPIFNVDGRARVPHRMIRHQGTDETIHEYFNTGGKPDGSLIGWPDCKRNIPLDFSTTQFPGGYPNDAGVNVQHDDFLGHPQPETRALLAMTAIERPDLILNMHTGADFMHPLRPQTEPALDPVYDAFYRRTMTALTRAGMQRSDDPAATSNPEQSRRTVPNLDTALNLHCGALAVTVESPASSFSSAKRNGKPYFHTPDQLLDAQLIMHQEALGFLAEAGGRVAWTAKKV